MSFKYLLRSRAMYKKEEEFDEDKMNNIYTMDQEGKSHKEITKVLKLKVSTVKTILALSDYAIEDVLNKFLKKILKSKDGEQFLMHQVNDDEGLVEAANNDALTWLALSQQQESQIAWCMKDDEGKYELEFYEPTIQGLDECISQVYGRQDEIDDPEKFKDEIISLSK